MSAAAGTSRKQLTWSLDAFDLLDLEELGLAAGIVSTEGVMND